MTKSQVLVFDFGGVLFNWQPRQLIQAMLPAHARNEQEAVDVAARIFESFVPGSDWSEFDRGALEWDEVSLRIARRTGLPQSDVHRLMEAIPHHLAPVADTVHWLQELVSDGVRLHFLSNMPRPYADHLRRTHAFLSLFESGLFSCDIGQIKPNDDIFETAAQTFAVNPAAAVFIDDNPHNIETASRLGWRAVCFENASQCKAELARRGWLP